MIKYGNETYSGNLNDTKLFFCISFIFEIILIFYGGLRILSFQQKNIFYIWRKLQLDEMINNNDKNEVQNIIEFIF